MSIYHIRNPKTFQTSYCGQEINNFTHYFSSSPYYSNCETCNKLLKEKEEEEKRQRYKKQIQERQHKKG